MSILKNKIFLWDSVILNIYNTNILNKNKYVYIYIQIGFEIVMF